MFELSRLYCLTPRLKPVLGRADLLGRPETREKARGERVLDARNQLLAYLVRLVEQLTTPGMKRRVMVPKAPRGC